MEKKIYFLNGILFIFVEEGEEKVLYRFSVEKADINYKVFTIRHIKKEELRSFKSFKKFLKTKTKELERAVIELHLLNDIVDYEILETHLEAKTEILTGNLFNDIFIIDDTIYEVNKGTLIKEEKTELKQLKEKGVIKYFKEIEVKTGFGDEKEKLFTIEVDKLDRYRFNLHQAQLLLSRDEDEGDVLWN